MLITAVPCDIQIVTAIETYLYFIDSYVLLIKPSESPRCFCVMTVCTMLLTIANGSKRHSLKAVELSHRTQAAVQIVSNLGARFTVFWACRSCGPAGWLSLLLTESGDVETNPGPTTLNKQVWICDICHKQIHVRKQISIRCNMIEHWGLLGCAGIRQAQYTDTWTCHLHRESRLTPHTDITGDILQPAKGYTQKHPQYRQAPADRRLQCKDRKRK